MGRFSARERNMLIVLLIFLGMFLYYNFVFKDFWEKSSSLDELMDSTQAEINDMKLKSAALKTVEDRINEVEKEIGSSLEKIMEGIDRPLILEVFVEEVFKDIKNPQYFFPYGHTSYDGNNYVSRVEIAFVATMDEVEEILERLEDAPYLNRVLLASLEFDSVKEEDDSDSKKQTSTQELKAEARLMVEFFVHDLYPPVR